MSKPKPMPGCGTSVCPKCGAKCPCVDHLEVDIGVGIQTGEHEYYCEAHGAFSFTSAGLVVFQDEADDVATTPAHEACTFPNEPPFIVIPPLPDLPALPDSFTIIPAHRRKP